MLEEIILGYLMCGEMSGYTIKKCISGSVSHFYNTSFGSLYPALKRMETKGLVSSRSVLEEGRNSILYAIEQRGRILFQTWLQEPASICSPGHEHLLKSFFYGYLPPEEAERLMRQNVEGAMKAISDLDALEETLPPEADRFQRATLMYGKSYYQHIMKWYADLAGKKVGDKVGDVVTPTSKPKGVKVKTERK